MYAQSVSSAAASEQDEKRDNELPRVFYNKQELQEIIEELPMAAEICTKVNTYLNTLETHFASIQRFQKKKNPADFYEAMQTILLEIRNIAIALYELTKAYHPSFPNTLKRKILAWIEPLEKELIRRLEMSAEDRTDLKLKTKHLYAEQSLFSREPSLQRQLMQHLGNLKQRISLDSGTPEPRCYISYAWPSKEHQKHEYWIQPFLYILYDHLTAAGVRVVMDIRDNKPGDSIYRFMQHYHAGNYVILVGTESLLQKHYSEASHAVQTELSIILNRFEQDQRQFGQSRIYPMLISGTMKTAYPERFQLYSTVRDARDQGYLGTLKKLIDWIFEARLSAKEIQAESMRLWRTFSQVCSGLSKDDLNLIEEEIALGYHRQRLDFLKQDSQYQSTQVQQETAYTPAVTAEVIGVLMQAQALTPKTLFDEHGQQFQRPFNNPDFIERKALSERMKQHFASTDNQILTLTTHGLGGMGKTELAQQYYLHPPRPYELRAWFHVKAGRESLCQQYLDFASANGLRFQEELKIEEKTTLVKRWLENQKDCLLVYDDVADAKILEALLPEKGKHHILITSRNEVDWRPDQKLDIDVMEEQEAINLIIKITGRSEDDAEKLILLVHTLGCLPLALAQAAAYMAVKSLNIDGYLVLYQQHQEKFLKEETRRHPKHEAIWVTFDMNFQALSEECPAALMLLKQVSWISSPIPNILLKIMLDMGKKYSDHHEASELLWGDVTEKLRCYSLMKVDSQQQQASIHPLLQDILRSKQAEEEQLRLRTDLCSLLNTWITTNNNREVAVDRMLLPHAEALYQQSQSLIRLAKTQQDGEKCWALIPVELNRIYSNLGLYQKGANFLRTLLSIAIGHYRESHINVANIQQNLANTLGKLGDYVSAKVLTEKALATKIAHYQTKSHVEVAVTQQNLAGTLETLGDYTAAKALFEKALATKIVHYQTEAHVSVAMTQQNLAGALQQLGDYVGAKALYEKALATTIAHYQTEAHVSVAVTQQNLAGTLETLGDYTTAKALYEKALATKIAHYQTEAHVSVAETQQNLAVVLERLGDYAAAKALFEKALATKIAHYQTEAHIEVAMTQQNLANTLERLGDYVDAKMLYEKALATKIAHYQTEVDVNVAMTQQNLANTLGRLGDYVDAKTLYEKALATKIAHYQTETHVDVAMTQQNLAATLARLGDYVGARVLFEKALSTKIAHYQTETHVDVAMTQYNLALLLFQLNDLPQAYSLLQVCETTFQTQPGGVQYLENCRELKKHMESLLLQQGIDRSENTSQTTQRYQNVLSFYRTPEPDQAIRRAAGKGDYANLAILLENHLALIDSIDIKPNQGWTALHWAVKSNQLQCVSELLSRKARYDIADKSTDALTSIDLCLKQANSEMLNLFVQHVLQKYLGTSTEMGKALRIAASKGDLEAVKVFIANHVDVNEAGPDSGKTALHQAVQYKHRLIVQALVQAGADISHRDRKGKSAMDYAENDEVIMNLFSNLSISGHP